MCTGCVFVVSQELLYNVSEAISFELRGFYNDDIRRGVHGKSGLSCFSPVINIMRHPLWGRNQVNISTIVLVVVRLQASRFFEWFAVLLGFVNPYSTNSSH